MLDKVNFVVPRIEIPSPPQHNHLNLIGLMPRLLERVEPIVDLFERIKLVEKSSHRPRLRLDIALGHLRIIRTENTP